MSRQSRPLPSCVPAEYRPGRWHSARLLPSSRTVSQRSIPLCSRPLGKREHRVDPFRTAPPSSLPIASAPRVTAGPCLGPKRLARALAWRGVNRWTSSRMRAIQGLPEARLTSLRHMAGWVWSATVTGTQSAVGAAVRPQRTLDPGAAPARGEGRASRPVLPAQAEALPVIRSGTQGDGAAFRLGACLLCFAERSEAR